jgi:hypothetical protein
LRRPNSFLPIDVLGIWQVATAKTFPDCPDPRQPVPLGVVCLACNCSATGSSFAQLLHGSGTRRSPTDRQQTRVQAYRLVTSITGRGLLWDFVVLSPLKSTLSCISAEFVDTPSIRGGNKMPLAFGLASSNVLVYSWIVQGPGAMTFSLCSLGIGSIINMPG